MKTKLALSIFLQLVSIPILYLVSYEIALVFHKPHVSYGSGGMNFYKLTLYFLSYFVAISLPILNVVQHYLLKNNIIAVLIHLGWFATIVWVTESDLTYRPYTYGLLLCCVGSTILSRLLIHKWLKISVV